MSLQKDTKLVLVRRGCVEVMQIKSDNRGLKFRVFSFAFLLGVYDKVIFEDIRFNLIICKSF